MSYTRKLLDRGVAHCAKKLGEEAVEAALAAVGEDRQRVIGEAADLLYHLWSCCTPVASRLTRSKPSWVRAPASRASTRRPRAKAVEGLRMEQRTEQDVRPIAFPRSVGEAPQVRQ